MISRTVTSHIKNAPKKVGSKALPPESLSSDPISIRPETPEDEAWIEGLHARVFGPGRFARTAFRVREQFAVDPDLSLVAEIEGERAGSVRMTPISLGGINGYLLGPLATAPAQRNRGVGRALVSAATEAGMAKNGADFVLLVGDAPYYEPLGFRLSGSGAIVFPGPVDPARILVHCAEHGIGDSLAGQIAAFRDM